MSERPPAPNLGPQAPPTPSEALAKVLAELRDLTPAASDPPPSFPPRLSRPERTAVRAKKIALEFERDSSTPRRSLKVVAASAVLVVVGAGAMNMSYPNLKALLSERSASAGRSEGGTKALRLAAVEPPAAAAAAAAPAAEPRGEPASVAVPVGPLASAAPEALGRPIAEPVEAGSVSTTGAMPTVVATAGPVLSRQVMEIPLPVPAPFVAIPSAPPAVPANQPETKAPEPAADPAPRTAPGGGVPTAAAPLPPPPETAEKAVEAKPVAAPAPASSVNIDRLVRRAGELVEQGDISAARLLLERALGGGSAQAAFALAQTYDPQVLAQWHAVGIKGDPARARELYQLASEKGIPGAKESMASLR